MENNPGRRLPFFLLQDIAVNLRRVIINFDHHSRAEIKEIVTANRVLLAETLEFYTNEARDPIVRVEDLAPLREHLGPDNP